jgi:hypothetical protein
MTRGRESPPTGGRISDAQYEQELRELEAERAQRLAAWEAGFPRVTAGGRADVCVKQRRRHLRQFIEITSQFWQAQEEAYFRCRRRNRHLSGQGRGRPQEYFRWFRTIPMGEAGIVERVVALMTSTGAQKHRGQQRRLLVKVLLDEIAADSAEQQKFQSLLDHYEEKARSNASARAHAVESMDRARFGRLERSISRRTRDRRK